MSAERVVAVQIQLPKELKDFADARAARGKLGSFQDYVRTLIERDREAAAHEAKEQQTLEAMRTGSDQALTAADWQKLREDLAKRFGGRG